MNAKRMLTGTIVGGVVLYVSGQLIWRFLLGGFYAANAGSATGVGRDAQVVWAIIVANLTYAALITYVVDNSRTGTSIQHGALVGAIVGFLLWATASYYF